MSPDDQTIEFEDGATLRDLKHFAIEPGKHSYELVSEATYDLILVVSGRGAVIWGDERHSLKDGSKFTVPSGQGYVLKSAADSGLTVTIYSIETTAH